MYYCKDKQLVNYCEAALPGTPHLRVPNLEFNTHRRLWGHLSLQFLALFGKVKFYMFNISAV